MSIHTYDFFLYNCYNYNISLSFFFMNYPTQSPHLKIEILKFKVFCKVILSFQVTAHVCVWLYITISAGNKQCNAQT